MQTPRIRRPDSLGYTLASSAIVSALVMVGYITWRVSFPPEAITMNRAPYVTPLPGRTFIRAGDPILVHHDYCKASAQYAVIGVYLVADSGAIVVPVVVMVTSLPTGCHKVAILMRIPAYTPPGRYALGITREYEPSPLDRKTYVFETPHFYVSSADE